MFLLCFLVLFGWHTTAFAEHLTEPNQVYNRSSQLTVQNINKTVEVLRDPGKVIKEKAAEIFSENTGQSTPAKQPQLRDPTQMGPTFRQALRSYSPKTTNVNNNAQNQPIVPTITLAGKVYVPPVPMGQKQLEHSSVALKIDGQILHLKEGDSSSVIKKEHLITVTVESISQYAVQIKLLPSGETLFLH